MIEQTQRKQKTLRKQERSSSKRFLANALDPIAQERLAKLRLGQTD